MFALHGYHVVGMLYESRNSRVYRGHRLADGAPAIFKLLNEDVPSPDRLARFQREFHLTQSLRSDGVVAAEALVPWKDSLVMVMEDFGGQSLNNLAVSTTLSLAEWLRLAIRIAECVGNLHAQQVIHKDLNPSNIVWNRHSGQLKLIDLGISTQLTREVPEVRNPERLEGTLPYVSPEQTGRMNRTLDYRTDFYSLGVSFYEMLTGQLPFTGGDPLELVHAHLAKMPLPVNHLNVNLPPVLAAIVAKLMAKNAEDRYQNATGLVADLQNCLQLLSERGQVPSFALGSRDFSERLQIPQKLYGREQEVATLLSAFERAAQGRAELLLVAGFSGIGKSALVHEVQKPITRRRGYFIKGKFDQFKRNIPYASLIQAFQELVRQLLTEGEDALADWKAALTRALGGNGQVIVDVIPEVEWIIGPQPPVPELPAEQAQNRFHRVLRQFVTAFASADHPLVIFLDDLQWADLPSLQLMNLLLGDADAAHLLLIGAYRDNEVSAAHPLTLSLEAAQAAGITVQTLTLPPLALPQVESLLCDTLRAPVERVKSLAALCWHKTHGNPFFLGQFLHALADTGLLWGDAEDGSWVWDVEAVRLAPFTDNVIDLMAGRIRTLPEATQQMLRWAAALGNVFDLALLARVCGMSEPDAAQPLWDALRAGLVLPLDDNYKYVGYSGEVPMLCPSYRFLHDRVQQAAYLPASEDEKAAMHLQIGRRWLESLSEGERDEQIFALVNHFNLGREQIVEPAERLQIAQLNLAAAQRAKASAAYRPAQNYAETGLSILGEADWKQHGPLLLALHLETAESAYLAIDFAAMTAHTEAVLANTTGLLDRVKAQQIRIHARAAENLPLEAIDMALDALEELGLPLPRRPNDLHVLTALLRTKASLAGRGMDKLLSRPALTDPRTQAAMLLLQAILAPSYFVSPSLFLLVVFMGVRLTVKHGNAPMSSFAYATYGMVLSGVTGEIKRGSQFGELALALARQSPIKTYRTRTQFIVHCVVKPWSDPIRNTLQPLLETYTLGMDNGDLEYGAYAANNYCQNAFHAGIELHVLDQDMARYCQVVSQLHQEAARFWLSITWQAAHDLIHRTSHTGELCGPHYDERELLSRHLAAKDGSTIFILYGMKLMLAYLYDAPSALAHAEAGRPWLKAGVALFGSAVYLYYDALTCLAAVPTADGARRAKLLRRARRCQRKLRHWANHAPANFLHKWHLVEAERLRVERREFDAIRHYESAIQQARSNSFVQDEALANELLGRFHLNRGEQTAARAYLMEAHRRYRRWGAMGKARQMEARYPNWLFVADSVRKQTVTTDVHAVHSITTTSTHTGDLDFATALKASQAISGEIVLDRLLKRLMDVVIENAGAQRGVLLLRRDQTWGIEAEKTVDQDEASLPQSLPLTEGEPRLPLSLVPLVTRTRETVVIADPLEDRRVSQDPYLAVRQPQSLLAMPIVHYGKVIGMLYLENELVAGVFTRERLQVLQLLTSQAAISIQNAWLYAEMEERVAERTAELEELATRDGLTGVGNRKAFDEALEQEMARVRRTAQPLSLILVDLDHFKHINDTHGHLAGDQCLKAVGEVLSQMRRRAGDVVARYGGEEFALLLPSTDLQGANLLAEEVLLSIRNLVVEVDEQRLVLTASLGVACADGYNATEPAYLIAAADRLLYAAKQAGRDRVMT